MQITSGKVVAIDYTLTDDNGQVLDSSEGKQPLVYLHGEGQIIFGLEKALNGKSVGDSLNVKVSPEEGYGERDETKIVTVSRDKLKGLSNIKEGMQLSSRTEQGQINFVVAKIEGDSVTLDGNHGLAGQNLNFDVTVRDIRPATAEEISHGHVHGPGGHHH